jgi:cobalt-zinc-cadmium efflux system protein
VLTAKGWGAPLRLAGQPPSLGRCDGRPVRHCGLVTRARRLWTVLATNLALVGALLGVGVAAHSLAVWAEGADYLADAAGIGVALFAIRLAGRPPTARHPEGFPRATRYAALVNAGWLFLLSLAVTGGAIARLVMGTKEVHGLPVLVVSGAAALSMLAAAAILAGDAGKGHDDLSVRAVLLDTAGDAAAAGGVAIAGATIYATHGLYWLDPSVALVIAVVVAYRAALLLVRVRDSLRPWGPRSPSGGPSKALADLSTTPPSRSRPV